jgi:hypothetical protein
VVYYVRTFRHGFPESGHILALPARALGLLATSAGQRGPVPSKNSPPYLRAGVKKPRPWHLTQLATLRLLVMCHSERACPERKRRAKRVEESPLAMAKVASAWRFLDFDPSTSLDYARDRRLRTGFAQDRLLGMTVAE